MKMISSRPEASDRKAVASRALSASELEIRRRPRMMFVSMLTLSKTAVSPTLLNCASVSPTASVMPCVTRSGRVERALGNVEAPSSGRDGAEPKVGAITIFAAALGKFKFEVKSMIRRASLKFL